jgi:methionyl-tRNA formyltransferase
MTQSLRLIFSGSGEFGLPTLRALLEAGHEVIQAISQPDRPAGRGRTMTPTPIAAFAASQNLPLLKTANINSETLPPADAMVVIAFGQKIGEAAVHHPRLGSVNLHASILPKYRGAAPINCAIIRGERVAGNSVIRLAPKMDAGAVLGQSSLDIGELETAGELHDRLAADGAPLVLKVLSQLATGTAVETPQDETLAMIAPKMSRESAKLDFARPAGEIANQIRGMYPWPGCRVRLIDQSGAEVGRATLCRARPTSAARERAAPGFLNEDGCIGTANGSAVEVVELQPEGKKTMSLAAFRNGHRWEAKMRVESIV